MLQIMPKSALLSHLIVIITQLNSIWDFILYQSFFQPRDPTLLQEYVDKLNVTSYEKNINSEGLVECAVCLCKIEGGDEVRELRCDHLFHKVCLDRWLGYGHVTCPLCRNNLKPRRFATELNQELIMIDFCAARSRDDRCTWWLR
ncbi:probable E3 ubiquitin-protein ligase xerico [Phtheirospermum japonicum]|uniref:Probable E3 ubiquitin-protein ligase xerico n=1 Tax=Phtheirospermum japonicum TaxID=374723 RepID=A0A830CPH3_9LAMI|nr:probable E3 ubiquitin-protein ligase xerico [Phtheirospermum japonicum]